MLRTGIKLFEDLEVGFEGVFGSSGVDRHGRVIERNYPYLAIWCLGVEHLAVDFADRLELGGQTEFFHDVTHSIAAQSSDHGWLNDVYLSIEERPVRGDLVRQRIPIERRTIFDDVGNVDIFTFDAGGLEQLVEYFPGRTD